MMPGIPGLTLGNALLLDVVDQFEPGSRVLAFLTSYV